MLPKQTEILSIGLVLCYMQHAAYHMHRRVEPCARRTSLRLCCYSGAVAEGGLLRRQQFATSQSLQEKLPALWMETAHQKGYTRRARDDGID